MLVRMCVQFFFPCPSIHIPGALKKKKKGLRTRGPTAPSLQDTWAGGDGWALGASQRGRRLGVLGRAFREDGCLRSPLSPFGRPSPIFPTSVGQRVKVSFLLSFSQESSQKRKESDAVIHNEK